MQIFPRLKFVAAAALLAAACSPAAERADTGGLPMWVIKDADSTIYLTGTVHMLPPDLEWKSAKLETALKDADELWLELPMKSDPVEMMRDVGPIMMKRMFSFNRPLSSLLTDEEEQQLAAAVERAKIPPQTAQGFENMKPWAVTMMLGMGPLVANGYDPEAGVDLTLTKMAEDQKDEIKGFETFQQQMDLLSGGAEEEQLAGLRAALSAPPEAMDELQKQSEAAFEAWAKGDPKPVEDLMASMAAGGPGMEGMSIETILYNRNEDWAGQIEKLLAGEGVSFIAVGAGHLVGPKSVQERLKLRGITAERY
jgi:hypothetical protein